MGHQRQFLIGTRGSPLALAQARFVQEKLRVLGVSAARLRRIRTSGDTAPHPAGLSGKGLFTNEIENALLAGEVGCAVHSLKDLPIILPEGLKLEACPEREDPRDVFISRDAVPFQSLPEGSRIGTASLRRQAQVLSRRPDLRVSSIRGNIETRLDKLASGQFEAIILAAAGLKRLGIEKKITEYFPRSILLPACGQGALAIEVRANDQEASELVAQLNHLPTWRAIFSERAFMQRLGASCRVPVAAYAEQQGQELYLRCFVADPLGKARIEMEGRKELSAGEELGHELAEACLEKGAAELLQQAAVN